MVWNVKSKAKQKQSLTIQTQEKLVLSQEQSETPNAEHRLISSHYQE